MGAKSLCWISLFILLSATQGWAYLTPQIPGFYYALSCRDRLRGVQEPIEVIKKTLPGVTWPKGAKEEFTFIEFNVLDMLDHHDAGYGPPPLKKPAPHLVYNQFAKPKNQLDAISNIYKKYPAWASFWVEIGALKIFSDYDFEFLNGRYEEFLIDGNDERGLDVGLLLDKRLPLTVEVHSHRNLIHEASGQVVFSRDLPAYIITEKGQLAPMMIIFGTHFKSQRSTDGDRFGQKRRTLQAFAAAKIIQFYEELYPGTPILLTGDLNKDWRRAEDFQALRSIGMIDAFDLAEDTEEFQRRGTHYYFNRWGDLEVNQLDAMLLNGAAIKANFLKSAKVLPHVDGEGYDLGPPRSYDERKLRGSDHLPIQVIFDLNKLQPKLRR